MNIQLIYCHLEVGPELVENRHDPFDVHDISYVSRYIAVG